MNISDVVTRVQRQFGDESGVQVSEADILRWINDAQNEAVLQHNYLLFKTTSIPTVANLPLYDLPTDCVDLKTVRYKKAATETYWSPLKYFSRKQLDEYIGNWSGSEYLDDPVLYTKGSTHKNINVFPTPTHALGLIAIEYGRYPVDVTTPASIIDLPVYYHPYVVEFCLMKAFEMDEEWEAMDRKAAYVQSTLDANFARDEQFGDVYPSITPVSEDYV